MNRSTKEILDEAKTVAVIGMSEKAYRTSHHIASFLQDKGYRIIPINPNLTGQVLGEDTYNTIKDVPEELKIDIIDIFRNKQYTEAMIDEIIEWSKRTGQKPVIWTQLDVSSDAARKKAKEAGFEYVENRCAMVEYEKAF